MKKVLFLIVLLSLEIFSQEIPKQINYQGVLKNAAGQNVTDGDYQLTFKIYNAATGGTALWTEVQTLPVVNGVFAAFLGSVTPLTPVSFDGIHYLGITVGAEAEMTPRTLFTPSPYSFMTLNVPDNIISTAKLQDGSVTAAKIAASQVVKSVNGITDNVTLVAGSNITLTPGGNNITITAAGGSGGSGTVTQVNTGGGLTGGPITTTGTISIASGAVTQLMLAGNSVTSAKIVDGAVVTADLSDNLITSAKIIDGTVSTADLGDNSVTSAKIADGTVTTADLSNNAVNSGKISDEPGYNYNNTGDANTLYPLTNTGQSFTSVTLNAPGNGYALVTANAMVFVTHINGTMDNVILKVSNTAGDVSLPAFGMSLVRIPGADPSSGTSGIVQTLTTVRVFPVTAGANTFHLNGYRTAGASSSLLAPEITAVFIPTRYGTGAKLLEQLPAISGKNNITGE